MNAVAVSGVGEVEVRPLLARLTVALVAHKPTVDECRASIDKRRPYVYQTLNQHQTDDIQEGEERTDGDGGVTLLVRITVQLPVKAVRNVAMTLLDKLTDVVTLKKLVFSYSHESMSDARVEAGRKAADEAWRRAEGMVTAVGSRLGTCTALVEEESTPTDLPPDVSVDVPDELTTSASVVVQVRYEQPSYSSLTNTRRWWQQYEHNAKD